MARVQPCGKNLLVRIIKTSSDNRRGGIIIPDSVMLTQEEGEVVAVSPKVPISVGVRVVFPKKVGHPMTVDGDTDYVMLKHKELLAIILKD